MPGFDGTGPLGRGPGTGGGFGPCGVGRFRIRGFRGGYGRGFGWGPGRGFRHWWQTGPVPYYSPGATNPDDEKIFLKEQAEQLKAELAEMEQRMAELEQT